MQTGDSQRRRFMLCGAIVGGAWGFSKALPHAGDVHWWTFAIAVISMMAMGCLAGAALGFQFRKG